MRAFKHLLQVYEAELRILERLAVPCGNCQALDDLGSGTSVFGTHCQLVQMWLSGNEMELQAKLIKFETRNTRTWKHLNLDMI